MVISRKSTRGCAQDMSRGVCSIYSVSPALNVCSLHMLNEVFAEWDYTWMMVLVLCEVRASFYASQYYSAFLLCVYSP